MIQSVPSENLRSSDEKLRSELEKIVTAEDELTALVKESKADGVLDPDEVAAMWQAAHSYLGLNPRHAKIAAMQQQLEARIQKAPANYAAFGELAGFWPAQPAAVLSQLPAAVLSQLPAAVLTQLPAAVLTQLPAAVLTPIIRNLPLSSNTLGMVFKPIIGGTFTMGEGGNAHKVTLTKPFEIGVYEVTQKQYEQVMGTNLSAYKGAQNPVDTVSWHEAVEFCRKLSALPAEQAAGRVYRLPTEAEWEYACRGGTTTLYSFGDDESQLGQYAWYDKNSGNTTHAVGGKKPNPWGLYDMHGQVWEWCEDWYGEYAPSASEDPMGASSGSSRVLRGGSWVFNADFCRSAFRGSNAPSNRGYYVGFRVVCELS